MYATDERYPDYMGYGGSDGYSGGGAGGGVSTFGYRPYGELLYTKQINWNWNALIGHIIQLELKMDFEFKVTRTQIYTVCVLHTKTPTH